MKQFTLPGTDLRTSVLGFGCASVMGRYGKRKSLNALAAAYDSGIIHYDIARSYGFGEAERIVGKFTRDKRDRICLVSKFGILPRGNSPVLRLIKPVARALAGTIPSSRRLVKRSGARLLEPGSFSAETARQSLHASLAALDTDTIDLYLLHDCTAGTPLPDELFDFLDSSAREGKIRHYGLATDPASAGAVLDMHPERNLSVVQTPLVPAAEFEQLTHRAGTRGRIVHSVSLLQSVLSERLTDAAHSVPPLPEELSREMARGQLSMDLLLRYAVYKSRGGVTLISSFRPEHIKDNARSVETGIAPESVAALESLLLSGG
jgi:aryl-alcohol dehydrogenase-like predicted oxidoreductase